MIWLNPLAGLGALALAIPILIHLLVHRRAEPLAFPTLRFIAPTRLASMRRRALDDLALLAVRAAAIAAAVAALAAPVIVTPARRAAWNARLARAIVVDDSRAAYESPADRSARLQTARAQADGVFRSVIIEAPAVSDGLRQALSWLETAPPARREIVCLSDFTIGSLGDADVRALPPDVGLKLVTTSVTLGDRILSLPPVWGANAAAWARTLKLRGSNTEMKEDRVARSAALPLDVLTSVDDRRAVDAAIAAVLSERVAAGDPGRAATLVLRGAPQLDGIAAGAAAIKLPWMADSVAAIADDVDLQRAAGDVATGDADAQRRRSPWQVVATAADGEPLIVAAASGDRLLVMSAASARSLATPLLVRAMLNAMGTAFDVRGAEVLPMPDARLRALERPAAEPPAPRAQRLDEDDRRWLWAAALLLLAMEAIVRRGRGARADAGDAEYERRARVA